jgi:hypothetical protein
LVQCGPFDIKPEVIPSTEAEMLGKFSRLGGGPRNIIKGSLHCKILDPKVIIVL